MKIASGSIENPFATIVRGLKTEILTIFNSVDAINDVVWLVVSVLAIGTVVILKILEL